MASLARGFLHGLSIFYGSAVFLRNKSFDCGLRRARSATVPVVSVGNLTTGGTGKTPFVAHLARWFRENDVAVALLSRGYRALADDENDEKRLLEKLCPDVPHLQNPDRLASAQRAVRDEGCRLLILDDGFQHRRLRRDCDIVLIDALCPWGYGHLLPRGLLREPVSALRRADLVVVTRAENLSETNRQEIAHRLAAWRGSAEFVEVAFPPVQLRNADGETADFSSLAGGPVAAFCGIGHPEAFCRTLASCGMPLEGFRPFPDHHPYRDADLDDLASWAHHNGFAALLTTQKDLVKINRTELGGCPLWAVEIGTKILRGEELLERHLHRVLQTGTG